MMAEEDSKYDDIRLQASGLKGCYQIDFRQLIFC